MVERRAEAAVWRVELESLAAMASKVVEKATVVTVAATEEMEERRADWVVTVAMAEHVAEVGSCSSLAGL